MCHRGLTFPLVPTVFFMNKIPVECENNAIDAIYEVWYKLIEKLQVAEDGWTPSLISGFFDEPMRNDTCSPPDSDLALSPLPRVSRKAALLRAEVELSPFYNSNGKP